MSTSRRKAENARAGLGSQDRKENIGVASNDGGKPGDPEAERTPDLEDVDDEDVDHDDFDDGGDSE